MKRGFTIIELIIAITIIAVLAGIVVVSVIGYINKSKSAAIKENLTTILSKSVAYYTNEENAEGYAGFGSSPTITNELSAIRSVQGRDGVLLKVIPSGTDFCVCVSLLPYSASGSNNSYFCVDSSGVRRDYTGKGANKCSTNDICSSISGQCAPS